MVDAGVEQIGAEPAPRVLHLITDAGPHPYFRTLIEAGGMDRATVMVGCVGPSGALQADMRSIGVATFALGSRSRWGYPLAVLRLVRILRRSRPDVVQTHLVDGCLVGLTAARIARIPVSVMTAHHSHELPFHGRRLIWTERLCAGPLSDHIIAPSRQVAAVLEDLAGVPPQKIEVIHHGFDLARLDPTRVNGAAVRTELGLDGKLAIGAVGRIYRLKNYVALIEAFAQAAAAVPEARLVIVGGGDTSELSTAANARGIGDRVLLVGTRHDIPQVLAALDVFVHPAIAESFGMVIVEAMAMGRPVLSTPVGIAPEIIEDGVTGWLAPSVTIDSLVNGLRRILAARDDWSMIGLAARRRASGFSSAAMAASYIRLYRQWLGAAPPCVPANVKGRPG